MKHFFNYLATVLFLSAAINLNAQVAQISHDLEIFSEDGFEFTLYLNGKKINEVPSSNVKVENTNNDYVLVKIVFTDTALGVITRKNLQIGEVGVAKSAPVSTVYKIKKKKEKIVLSFVSRSPKQIQNSRSKQMK